MNKTLSINKLIIEGSNYKRTLNFSKGLNVIKGDMNSGKSLVLNLINYLFGKKEKFKQNVQKELKEYCDIAYMEIEISGEKLTIKRNLWNNTNIIGVYFCDYAQIENYSPRMMDLDGYYDFLFEKLRINQFNLIKFKSHSREKELQKISFRDLMRFIYVNQHELGTIHFMKEYDSIMKNKNHFMFEILHDLVETDSKNIAQDLAKYINEKESIKSQATGLKAYINELGLENTLELQKQFDDFNDKINKTIGEKKQMLECISNKKNKKDSIYTKTKSKTVQLINEKLRWEEKERDLMLAINSKKKLLQDYKNELEELVATKEGLELLTIDKHTYKCPICSNEIPHFCKDEKNIESINRVIQQLENKIVMVESSINSGLDKIKDIHKNVGIILEEKNIYDKALAKFEEELNVPYISEIESINKILIELQRKKDNINENIKIFNKIKEKEIAIEKLEEKIKDLNEKLNDLKVEGIKKESCIQFLNLKYRKILEHLKLNVNDLDCYIDSKKYIPIYENATVLEHDSGGVLMCMQIAYLSSILCMKKNNEDLKHPGLLMFDTVGKYLGTYQEQFNEEIDEEKVMDPITYEQIYRLFINLGDDFQLIIVDNIPHVIAEPYVKYTFHHGGLRGLIDINKNELNK